MTAWTTVQLTVTTPLFNGGASVSDPVGVRVPSLKGPMRFWFRALAAAHTGPDAAKLAALEAEVFGSTDVACPVPLRIPEPPHVDNEKMRATDPGLLYLLGPGLGDVGEQRATRSSVGAKTDFSVRLRLGGAPERAAALTLAALWLTCAYGGLGARTRRGFGGVRITSVTGDLPPQWTPESLLTPSADNLATIAVPETVRDLLGPARAWDRPPPFPVLDPTYLRMGLSGDPTTWSQTLIRAGFELRHFRADVDDPAANYRPQRKTTEWLNTVHGPHRADFPLGALGLPIVFKKGVEVVVQGTKPMRRASPLWLRAVGAPGRTRLLSLAFLGEFLPAGGPTVKLGNRELTVTAEDVRRQAEQWISTLDRGGSFETERRV